mgnify:FL=1
MKPAGSCSLLLDRNGHLERLTLKLSGADHRHVPDALGCARCPGEGGHAAAGNEERGWGLPLTRQLRHSNLALRAGTGPHGEDDLRATGDGG